MKKAIKILFRISSLLSLATLVFLSTLFGRFAKTDSTKGPTRLATAGSDLFSTPHALADTPATGTGTGSDPGGGGCDSSDGSSGDC